MGLKLIVGSNPIPSAKNPVSSLETGFLSVQWTMQRTTPGFRKGLLFLALDSRGFSN